jgi:hypothetical protein
MYADKIKTNIASCPQQGSSGPLEKRPLEFKKKMKIVAQNVQF